MKGASLCFVAPGQIHQYIHQKDNEGWFLFAEAGSISEWYRKVLDMHQWIHQAVSIEENDLIFDLLILLGKTERETMIHHLSIERSWPMLLLESLFREFQNLRYCRLRTIARSTSLQSSSKSLLPIILKVPSRYSNMLSYCLLLHFI